MKVHFLFQPGALWIGAHYSPNYKRWCINIVPMLTICVVEAGGVSPYKCQEK
jgi:hypothetical protein